MITRVKDAGLNHSTFGSLWLKTETLIVQIKTLKEFYKFLENTRSFEDIMSD